MRQGTKFRGIALFLLSAVLSACGSKRPKAHGANALSPLSAPSWLVPLAVPAFGDARVAVPLGARSPRPLLVAIHGEVDRPEWQCGSYRGLTHGRSFIVCPQGDTAPELRAAIAALKARFGAHLARGPVVLAALGPGVEHALTLALEEPSFFSRLVLVNGSLSRLTPAVATRFGQAGGKRVLCVCSAGSCGADADLRVQSLRPAGVDARLIVPERGQGLDADVVRTIEEQWAWLVSSDARWE